MNVQIRYTGFDQTILINDQPFVAKIFEGEGLPPEGFNVLCLRIDVSDRSLLSWQKEIILAKKAAEKGVYILWELDFQLLKGCLEDEARFLTFQLNIEHFNETIWKNFKSSSLGVAIFRGNLQKEVWDYLKSLIPLLEGETCCFLFLDATSARNFEDYLDQISLSFQGAIYPILKGNFHKQYPFAIPALAWGHGFSPLGYYSHTIQPIFQANHLRVALCISEKLKAGRIESAVNQLKTHPFRLIHENCLTQEWEGIDQLVIFPETLTEKTLRKLRGFIAAGGEVREFPNDSAWLLPLETFPLFSLSALI